MSDNKKYYYLKLKDNFFDRPEIRAIESMQNGYEYICIMQKMYLRSLEREGKLMLTDTIPYDLTMLSKVLNHRDDTIKCAIEIFLKLGLCDVMSDQSIYMTEIQNFIGQSSTEGERKKIFREKIKGIKKIGVDKRPDKRPPEIEIEIEIEKEIEKEKKKRFTPPTYQEVKDYIASNSYDIDAATFVDFYASKGWMVGKNKMKDWKAAVRNCARNEKKFGKKEIPSGEQYKPFSEVFK